MSSSTQEPSPSSPSPRPYLVTVGEVLGVLSAPEPGPLGLGSALRLGIAGAESNVAVGVEAGSAGRSPGSAASARTTWAK